MDQLTATFAALADPTRRAILARLAMGETSVTELARPFEMSMPAVSKHLKVLEHAGLIARGREAQWRPCRLEAGPLKEVAGWIEEYRRFWSPYVDALERHLDRMERQRTDEDLSAGNRDSTPTKVKTEKTSRPKPPTRRNQ
jgi:DNA-binding transcriptional ArsR family regulator